MRLIDVHVYYGKWIYPILKTGVEDLIHKMDVMGIEKAIIMSALSINYDMAGGNEEVAGIVEKYPRLYGYVYVNGNYPGESVEQLEKYFKSDKFVGVKFHPEYSRIPFNSPFNEPIFDCIEKYDKPVNVHTWPAAEHGGEVPCSTPQIVAEVAKKRPKLKILAGHMGGPAWRETVNLAKGIDNLWVDHISSWGDNDKVGYAVRELGADRVLFGTGMTEGNGISQLGVVLDADLTEQEKFKFCYQNAVDLFKLD